MRDAALNYRVIFAKLRAYFPNTYELATKAVRFIGWKLADPEAFYDACSRAADINSTNIKKNYPNRKKSMLANLRSIVAISREYGSKVILTQISNMMAAEKTLVSFEDFYFKGRGLIHSDRRDELSRNRDTVDRFAYQQIAAGRQLVDRKAYGELYRDLNRATEDLASRLDAGYVNFQAVLDDDKYDNDVLYVSYSHLSLVALDVLGKKIADYVIENDYLVK